MTAPTTTRTPVAPARSRIAALDRCLGESAFRIALTRDLLDELAQRTRLPQRRA